MKIVPKKASYSTSLLRNASDADAATLLHTILNMADASKNGEVIITKITGGYEFIR